MVSGFGQLGMLRDVQSRRTCQLAPCPQAKVTVPVGHHSWAGTEGDGDTGVLPCCPCCSSPPSPVNPMFEAAEHPEENGTGGRTAPGTGRSWLGAAQRIPGSEDYFRGAGFAGRVAGFEW